MDSILRRQLEISKGPRASLSIDGYINAHVYPGMKETVSELEDIRLEDFYIDVKSRSVIMRPMPAFMCILENENAQDIYEAVNHFLIKDEYGELLKFLKSRGALSDYQNIAEYIFGAWEEEKLVEYFNWVK